MPLPRLEVELFTPNQITHPDDDLFSVLEACTNDDLAPLVNVITGQEFSSLSKTGEYKSWQLI
jgi:hypothetical protein